MEHSCHTILHQNDASIQAIQITSKRWYTKYSINMWFMAVKIWYWMPYHGVMSIRHLLSTSLTLEQQEKMRYEIIKIHNTRWYLAFSINTTDNSHKWQWFYQEQLKVMLWSRENQNIICFKQNGSINASCRINNEL